ncbi:WXG100 family type VII secretion target [Streptosporangium sp. NPDC002721]|uniref:WXG100 family type VII secretion target n=1 Tax=Streptosporangium sp. NPDC002721 TaxID=3366188 RepID=UPI0036BC67D8
MAPDPDSERDFAPRTVNSWPGLGDSVRDVVDVNHRALRAAAERLVVDLNDVGIPTWWYGPEFKAGDWDGAADVSRLFRGFTEDLFCVASDAMVECVAAACGVATAGRNYDVADHHGWLTRQSVWNRLRDPVDTVRPSSQTPRSSWSSYEKGYAVSSQYPHGNVYADRQDTTARYDYDGLGKEQVRALLMSGDEHSIREYSRVVKSVADDLEGLQERMRAHANDVSRHWAGPAAERAQRALKTIYQAVTPLAEAHHSLGALARTCADVVVAPAKARFDHAVAGENWLTDIFQDDDDRSARDFLRAVDQRFRDEVLARFPRHVRIDLPGLIPAEDRLTYLL